RLDTQETHEQDLFLGHSTLMAHRNHILFKPTDTEGYLSGSALHLARPRQLIAPHEDAQSINDRLHPLQKRSFAQAPFSKWFDKVYARSFSQSYLIENFVSETIGHYKSMQNKLLKQAAVLAKSLYEEFEQGQEFPRQEPAFQLRFLQTHGFLPSSSFYEFLNLPVRNRYSISSLNQPLWQVLGAGKSVQWEDLVLEEQPLDLQLLHFLALYAQQPKRYAKLLSPMAVMDSLLRSGDYFGAETPPDENQEPDQKAKTKSLAALRAYEHLFEQEEEQLQPNHNHKLGDHFIVWNRETGQTPMCGASLNHEETRWLSELFADLQQTMKQAGVWREDIAKCARLLSLQFAKNGSQATGSKPARKPKQA
ncbi:MAG: hypothetical protein R3194_08840, partial [Limnobacter sp.]|nr:hypothetical protein [Limnobacter sp.]